MKSLLKFVPVLLVAVSLAACAGQKAPAEAALKAAQDAFTPVSADAQKYVPDQAKTIQDAIASAQAALAKGDYPAVIQQAQGVPAQVATLRTAIDQKKAEFSKSWADMSAGVPKLVAALQSRVDILSKSKNPPAGLTSATIDSAKTGLATATQMWSDAMSAAQSGDLASAASKATAVKTQVTALMKSLNMQVPGGGL